MPAFDGYDVLAQLGKGTYGVAFRAVDLVARSPCAIKRFKHARDDYLLDEAAVLAEFRHPHVLKMLGTVPDPAAGCDALITECHSGCLHQISRDPRWKTRSELARFARQMFGALEHVHARGYAHLDVSPNNVFVGHDGRLVLGDFGMARRLDAPLAAFTYEVVSLWYRAPELLAGDHAYGAAVDVWSVGCILAELAVGRPLFPGTPVVSKLDLPFEIDQARLVYRAVGFPSVITGLHAAVLERWRATWKAAPRLRTALLLATADAAELATGALLCDPANRWTASQCLESALVTLE